MELKNCTPVLFVKDALKSRDFYTSMLGMTVIMNNGDQNFMFKEGFAIWQISEENIIPKKIGLDKISDSNAPSRFELCFETEELDTICQILKNHHIKFMHEINTELWGQRTIRFYDPNGHLIEVGEAMQIFLRRIYEEEGENLEATSRRTFTSSEVLKHFLELE
jgi:catechol 2,3-dioxygenase-like lactoylglutathione lyase family enzyme